MLRARRATQQRLHLASEIVVAMAFALDERLTLVRWSFQRRVVEPLDVAPAFGVHGLVLGGGSLHRTFFTGSSPLPSRHQRPNPAGRTEPCVHRMMLQTRRRMYRDLEPRSPTSDG